MNNDEMSVDFPMELVPERTQVLLNYFKQVSGCPISVVFAHVMFVVSSIIQRKSYVNLRYQDRVVRPQMQFIELDTGAYKKEKLVLREIVFWPLHRINPKNEYANYKKLIGRSRLFCLESCKDRLLKKLGRAPDLSFAVIDDNIGKTLSTADLRVLDDQKYLWGGRDNYLQTDMTIRFRYGKSKLEPNFPLDVYRPGINVVASGAFYLSGDPTVVTQRVEKGGAVGADFFARSVFVLPSSENVFVENHAENSSGGRCKQIFDSLFLSFAVGGPDDLEINEELWNTLVSQVFDGYRTFARVLDNPRVLGYVGLQETNALKMAICLYAIEWILRNVDKLNGREARGVCFEELFQSALALQAWFVDCYLRAFVPEYAYFLERDSHIEAMNQYLLRRFEENFDNPDLVRYDNHMQCYVLKIAKNIIRKGAPGKIRETAALDFMINVMKDLGLVHVDKAYKGKYWCYFAMRPETGLVMDSVGPEVAAFRWRDFQPFGVGSKEAALKERFPGPEFVDTGRFRVVPKP